MSDHRYFVPHSREPGKSIGWLVDQVVPVNVAHLNIWPGNGKIQWQTRSGGFYEMDWPPDGDVTPIIVAMRMST